MDEGNLYYNYFLLVYTLFYLKKEDSNHFFSRDKHLSSSLKKTLKTFYCNLANKNSFDTVNLFLIHQKNFFIHSENFKAFVLNQINLLIS